MYVERLNKSETISFDNIEGQAEHQKKIFRINYILKNPRNKRQIDYIGNTNVTERRMETN